MKTKEVNLFSITICLRDKKDIVSHSILNNGIWEIEILSK